MSKDFGYSDSKKDALESKIRALNLTIEELESKIIEIDHAHGCYMDLCKKQSNDLDNAGNELFLQEGKIKELEAKNGELEKKLEIAVEALEEIAKEHYGRPSEMMIEARKALATIKGDE